MKLKLYTVKTFKSNLLVYLRLIFVYRIDSRRRRRPKGTSKRPTHFERFLQRVFVFDFVSCRVTINSHSQNSKFVLGLKSSLSHFRTMTRDVDVEEINDLPEDFNFPETLTQLQTKGQSKRPSKMSSDATDHVKKTV